MDIGAIEWVAGSVVVNNDIPPTVTGMAVNGATTVWSNNFRLSNSRSFGCMVVCTGTPQIQIQLEESWLSLGRNGYPQGATNIFYVVPDAYPDIFSQITDTNWHVPAQPVTPIPMKYARFKINGLIGNGSNTTVAIGFFRQESGRYL